MYDTSFGSYEYSYHLLGRRFFPPFFVFGLCPFIILPKRGFQHIILKDVRQVNKLYPLSVGSLTFLADDACALFDYCIAIEYNFSKVFQSARQFSTMRILNLTFLASVIVSAAAYPIADGARPGQVPQDPYHRFTRWWGDNTNLGTFIGVPFGPAGIVIGTKAWHEAGRQME